MSSRTCNAAHTAASPLREHEQPVGAAARRWIWSFASVCRDGREMPAFVQEEHAGAVLRVVLLGVRNAQVSAGCASSTK